jgi:hypothetical protein
VVVLNARDHVVRTSRPIDPSRHATLSESGAGFHHIAPSAAQVVHLLDSKPRLLSTIYLIAAVLMVLSAAYSLVRTISTHEALRVALAIILVGFGIALGYEAVAVRKAQQDGKLPTIGRIAGGAFLHHPVSSWLVMTGVCVLMGALVVHFTHLEGLQIWVLLVAVVAFLAGALAGTDRWLSLLK